MTTTPVTTQTFRTTLWANGGNNQGAKTDETRDRRVAKVLDALS